MGAGRRAAPWLRLPVVVHRGRPSAAHHHRHRRGSGRLPLGRHLGGVVAVRWPSLPPRRPRGLRRARDRPRACARHRRRGRHLGGALRGGPLPAGRRRPPGARDRSLAPRSEGHRVRWRRHDLDGQPIPPVAAHRRRVAERDAGNDEALPNITALLVDSSGGVWIGGSTGLVNMARGNVRVWRKADGLPAGFVHALAPRGRDGSGWAPRTAWLPSRATARCIRS